METVLEAAPTNVEVPVSNPVAATETPITQKEPNEEQVITDPVSNPVATENPITEKESNEEHEQKMIDAAFEKIRLARNYFAGSVRQQIGCYCSIGRELIDLKKRIPHGQWEKQVKDEFGYDPATQSRLRKIANADMATQIVTMGQDLRLSSDLQKLAKLASLPCEHWSEALKTVDLATASRFEVRRAIDKLRVKYGVKDDSDDDTDAQKATSAKRRVSVARIQKRCGSFTDFATAVTEELRDETTDVEKRSQVKEVLQNAVATLQKLLDACEQTAS